MTDLFGVPVNIGDKVAYTTGSQGNETMEIGTILDITSYTGYSGIVYESVILKSSRGRKMSNPQGTGRTSLSGYRCKVYWKHR